MLLQLMRISSRNHIFSILALLNWLPVKFRTDFNILLLTYKAPAYFKELLVPYHPSKSRHCLAAGLRTCASWSFQRWNLKTQLDILLFHPWKTWSFLGWPLRLWSSALPISISWTAHPPCCCWQTYYQSSICCSVLVYSLPLILLWQRTNQSFSSSLTADGFFWAWRLGSLAYSAASDPILSTPSPSPPNICLCAVSLGNL